MLHFRKPSIKNTTVWMIICAALLLFIPLNFVVERQSLFKATDSILIATGFGIMVAFSVGAWDALRLPPHKMTAADLAIVAIFLGSFFYAWIFAGQWYWRAEGKPDEIIDSAWLAFPRFGLAVSMAIMMAMGFSKDGLITVGATGKIAVLLSAVVFLAAILISFGIG